MTTNMGTFTIQLDPENAPRTVANFAGLATGEKAWRDAETGVLREGVPFYDGLIFHRVIAGFMNQGGCPLGTGTAGPGYRFIDETENAVFNQPYRVAMANSGRNTNGSQFFITAPTTSLPAHLNGLHTIFGFIPEDDGGNNVVTGSRAVIDAINAVDTSDDRPLTPVVIESVTIRRVGVEAEAFPLEHHDLPVVAKLALDLTVDSSGSMPEPILHGVISSGSLGVIEYSDDLMNWRRLQAVLAIDAPPLTLADQNIAGFLQASNPPARTDQQFFRALQVIFPPAVTIPASVRNISVLATGFIGDSPIHSVELLFNAAGNGGSYAYRDAADEIVQTGTITEVVQFQTDATRPDGNYRIQLGYVRLDSPDLSEIEITQAYVVKDLAGSIQLTGRVAVFPDSVAQTPVANAPAATIILTR
ncbi:MAG: peptidylprolyl isomerase [Puniceicoccaceae bacterium]|nr:MAG: peptidylprolyl isomerase [Puniceicoccaceae bacterium]